MPTLGSLTFSKRVAWQSASTPAPLHPCLLFLYVYYLYITASFGPQRPCRKYGNFFRVNFTERNSFKVLIPTADTDASSIDTLSPHLNCHCWIMIRSTADEQVAPILRSVCGSYLSSHLPTFALSPALPVEVTLMGASWQYAKNRPLRNDIERTACIRVRNKCRLVIRVIGQHFEYAASRCQSCSLQAGLVDQRIYLRPLEAELQGPP